MGVLGGICSFLVTWCLELSSFIIIIWMNFVFSKLFGRPIVYADSIKVATLLGTFQTLVFSPLLLAGIRGSSVFLSIDLARWNQ